MSAGSDPTFSIVVPTRDRPESLARCASAIAALEFPRGDFEVVIVDDGSAISAEPSIARILAGLSLTFVHQAAGGPASARNAGAAHARGPILVFTDDDCEPEPGWLAAIARTIAAHPDSMVGGRIVNGLERDRFASASQLLIAYLYDYYAEGHPSRFFCTNNLALDALRFRELGGFDTSFPQPAAEDRDLCDRWLLRGHPMRYEPRAVVRHYHEMDLGGFLRQHFRYGQGAFRFSQLRRARGGGVLRVEPAAFYTGMLRRPFETTEHADRWRTSALLAASQVAGAAGFAWARWSGGRARPASAAERTGRRTPDRNGIGARGSTKPRERRPESRPR